MTPPSSPPRSHPWSEGNPGTQSRSTGVLRALHKPIQEASAWRNSSRNLGVEMAQSLIEQINAKWPGLLKIVQDFGSESPE
jgi:hypothetical protein